MQNLTKKQNSNQQNLIEEQIKTGDNTNKEIKIDPNYIIWLINSYGSFGFTSSGLYRNKIPTFQLKMTVSKIKFLEQIRDYLGLKNKIYKYHYPGKDKSKREPQAILIVRDFKQLKDIIIPFFYKKLTDEKRSQFIKWLEKIDQDPEISDRFKSLYRLYKLGVYDTNPKFTEKFKD